MPETQTVLSEAPRIHRCAKHPNLIQHRELSDAFAAVARARTRRGIELHVYSCRDCGFYHLSRNGGKDSIGEEVMALPVYTTETPPGDPALRDVFTKEQRVLMALSDMGDPDTVRARDVAPYAGMTRDQTTETLRKMGWERTGKTKAVRWNRPGTPREEVPVQQETPPPTERLPLGDIGDLTLDQIRRAAEAFGVSIEIEVTIWDRKGPGR